MDTKIASVTPYHLLRALLVNDLKTKDGEPIQVKLYVSGNLNASKLTSGIKQMNYLRLSGGILAVVGLATMGIIAAIH